MSCSVSLRDDENVFLIFALVRGGLFRFEKAVREQLFCLTEVGRQLLLRALPFPCYIREKWVTRGQVQWVHTHTACCTALPGGTQGNSRSSAKSDRALCVDFFFFCLVYCSELNFIVLMWLVAPLCSFEWDWLLCSAAVMTGVGPEFIFPLKVLTFLWKIERSRWRQVL